jgi:homoserine kinase type II
MTPCVATFTPLTDADVRALLRGYDVGELQEYSGVPAGSVNSNFLIRTGSGRFFLRVYEEQQASGAGVETRLLTYLAARGVPTPRPVARTDGGLVSETHGKPAALFPWIDGTLRCQAAVGERDCEAVGAALARVHVAGEGAEAPEGRFREADLVERLRWIANGSFATEADPLRAALARWSAARDPALRRGLVHGDLFRDNVLWNGSGSIVALLDFESASDGVLAYDLMVTMLAWCVGDAFDWRLARALVRGYASVRALEENEREGLLAEGCMAAIRFSVTRITDYAMRDGVGPRVIKDYRRFLMRLSALEGLGGKGLRRALFD